MVPLFAVEFVTLVFDSPRDGELMLLVETELVTVPLDTFEEEVLWEKGKFGQFYQELVISFN